MISLKYLKINIIDVTFKIDYKKFSFRMGIVIINDAILCI